MKHLAFIIFFTLSNLTCTHAQQPTEEKLSKQQAQKYFRLIAFLPVIGSYRTVQIECSALYPENAEEYESYFKEGNYEYFERRLKNAIPELLADLYFEEKTGLGRTGSDAFSKDFCSQMLTGVTQIAMLLEPDNAQRIDVDHFILFIEKITNLSDEELIEYLRSLK